jgi:hypothetical protein
MHTIRIMGASFIAAGATMLPFTPLFAHAASITGTAKTAVSATLGSSTSGGIKTALTSTTTVTTHTSTTTTTTTGIDTSVGAEAHVGGAGSGTSDTGSVMVSIMPTDVDSMTVVNTTTLDAAAVATSADLNAYAKATTASDKNVRKIESSSSSVSLGYFERAHLFGFIPVTVTVVGNVAADGTVSVTYPWYSFLLSTDRDAIQTSLQNRVQAEMTTMMIAPSSSTPFTAVDQAHLLADIRTVLKTEHDTTIGSTDTTVNADTNTSAAASASGH